MASYSILIKKSAEKELRAVPKETRRRIVMKIRQLGLSPRPKGSEKLSGKTIYRIRQGDYRVIYSIDDASKAITVEKVGHRKEVYR